MVIIFASAAMNNSEPCATRPSSPAPPPPPLVHPTHGYLARSGYRLQLHLTMLTDCFVGLSEYPFIIQSNKDLLAFSDGATIYVISDNSKSNVSTFLVPFFTAHHEILVAHYIWNNISIINVIFWYMYVGNCRCYSQNSLPIKTRYFWLTWLVSKYFSVKCSFNR